MAAKIHKYSYLASCLVIAVIFTGYVVSWSSHYGKLSVPPDYDDSHSMVEGGIRLLNFQTDGFQAAWDEYRLRNTHSFLHYYWPALLYSVFGIHQSVVYWGNALFLFGVVVSFGSMLPRINGLWKLVWIGAFLGFPVSFHLIHDFRSEVTMAALIFMGCASALLWAWESERKTLRFVTTALSFALALGMKPVMFPYTLGMLGLCSMVYLNSSLFRRNTPNAALQANPGEEQFSLIVKSFTWLIALWAAVILPNLLHFYLYSRFIIGYIKSVAFGSDFYKLKDAQGAQWAFHWLGYSGVWHLSVLNIFLAAIIGTGLVACMIPQLRKYSPDGKWLSLAFMTSGAFLGIAINSVHQPFFGMTFQLLLVATALSCLAHFFAKPIPLWLPVAFVALFGFFYINPALNRPITLPAVVIIISLTLAAYLSGLHKRLWVAFICSGLAAILCWQTTAIAPYHNYVERTVAEAGESGLEWRRQGPGRVFDMINKSWKDDQRASSPIIWCSAYGWVDGRTIAWEAVKRSKRWLLFSELELPKPIKTSFPPYADYLVIANSGVLGSIQTPHSSRAITDIRKFLDENRMMELVGEVTDPKGNKMTILKNNDPEKMLKAGEDYPDWLLAKIHRMNLSKSEEKSL